MVAGPVEVVVAALGVRVTCLVTCVVDVRVSSSARAVPTRAASTPSAWMRSMAGAPHTTARSLLVWLLSRLSLWLPFRPQSRPQQHHGRLSPTNGRYGYWICRGYFRGRGPAARKPPANNINTTCS